MSQRNLVSPTHQRPPSQRTTHVALVGCGDASNAIRRRTGMATRSYASVARAQPDLTRGAIRALVLHASQFESREELSSAIRSARRVAPLTEILVWDPGARGPTVREALRAGAEDVVLSRSVDQVAAQVAEVVESQRLLPRLQQLERNRTRSSRFEGLVSRSAAMWEIFQDCVRIAPTEASVLILGETGTGKELVARAIHNLSERRNRFVAVNCGAVPETLFESELFGHEKGSFTGAASSKRGLFRHADGGTLFLDEIGNMPLSAQFSLLRALQEGAVRPVGGREEIPVDVRVIAATSVPLEEAVRDGRFREDLLYRLDVIRFVLPPLRERPEDILFLFGHFKQKLARHHGLEPPEVSDAFIEAALAHPWPGNVRELENFTERLVLTRRRGRLGTRDFERLTRSYATSGLPPVPGDGRSARARPARPEAIDLERPLSAYLDPLVEDLERRYLEAALRRHRGRIQDTADTAGLSRRTLLRKLKKYGIEKNDFK